MVTSAVSLPTNVTVALNGVSTYTWGNPSTVVQSLEVPPSGATRIAACWFSTTSFTVDVNTGAIAYDLELYVLDYDERSRVEQIQLSNAGSGTVLNTQSVSGFSAGTYLSWRISGSVLIKFTNEGPVNAVLSGLFFDPATPLSTVTGVSASPAPSTYGQAVTFTATVADTGNVVPTGTVEFFDGSTALGPGTALSGTGESATSTITTTTLAAGSHPSITAVYSPAGSFVGSSGVTSQTVTPAALTITAVTNTKVYDGTTTAAAIPIVSGLEGSDTVTNLTETYATATVGTGKTLNVSTYTVNDGNGGHDYTVTLVANTTGVITASSVATASFWGEDTTTQGSWIGKYGSQGYDMVTSAVSLPAGVTVAVNGTSTYTWGNPSTVVQSLEVPPAGATRIAACWFSSTSFTVDVTTGTGAYNLELYVLDYDKDKRSEQIQLSDAGSGTVLSTQSVSGFSGGAYMKWAISGNVLITITNEGPENAVLSGLFFDPEQSVSTVTGVSSSPGPSTYGQSVTFTATINNAGGSGGVPTGSIEFYDGTTDLGHGSPLSGSGTSATSTFSVATLPAGTDSISAVYTPTGLFAGSTGTTNQIVNQAVLTITAVTNTKVYDGTTTAAAIPIVSGLEGSDTVTNLTETYATATVGTGKTLNVSTYTVNDGNGGHNYAVTLVANTTGVITASSVATASFWGEDTTTQGSWIGKYGSQGYDMVTSAVSLPAGVTVAVNGTSTYTWGNPSTVVQSLEVPPAGATRIAACWFSSTSFTVDVTTGTGAYNLELYVLDYDKDKRSEQIQLSDAGSGTVLSTQSVSGFSGGAYMKWAISGNVLITITNEGPENAVLSGLFFDAVTTNNALVAGSPTSNEVAAAGTAIASSLGVLDFTTSDGQAVTTTVASAAQGTPLGKPRGLVAQGLRAVPSGWPNGLGTF